MARNDRESGNLLEFLMRVLDARESALHGLIARRRDGVDFGPPSHEPTGDEVDFAQERERQMVNDDLLDMYLAELDEIGAARERIAAGTYKLCVDCGEPIGAGRLRAQPTARRCVDCQARRERFASAAPW